ncbi:MAG: porin family protein [Chitinophagaceae bacterium]
MKKLFIICCSLLATSFCWAQESSPTSGTGMTSAVMEKGAKDYVIFQISDDGWAGKPNSIQTTGFSRGFNFALMYDFPIKHTKLSLGVGLGISSSSIFLKQTIGIADTNQVVPFNNTNPYKKYKLATSYIEIPVELRYRSVPQNANKGFKASIGLKFGMLVNAHTKGKLLGTGAYEIDKVNDKKYFNPYRVDATARIGLGNIALFYAYSLTSLFKQGAGPSISPYQIGITISGM